MCHASALAIHPSGSFLYAAIYTQEIRVIDTATLTVVGSPITLPGQPLNIAVNPTGTYLYVAQISSNSILAIRTADRAVTPIPVGESTRGIAVHPSGSFIYASSATSVHVIDAGTHAVMTLFHLEERTVDTVSFNTDGTRAYVPITLYTVM